MKVESSIDVDASPEEVYGLVMDPSRLGDWVSIHDRLEEAPDGELDRSSELDPAPEGRRSALHCALARDRGRPRHARGVGRPGPASHTRACTYDFADRDGGTRSRYMNEYDLPGGVAGKLGGRAVSRVAKREVERSLERLKQLAEN